MQVVFEYFDSRESGGNFVLYNSQKAKKNETRSRKQILTIIKSFILKLVRLHRNFDVYYLAYLFKVSEGTVTNTFLTWINFM